jgi:hypothetical protein
MCATNAQFADAIEYAGAIRDSLKLLVRAVFVGVAIGMSSSVSQTEAPLVASASADELKAFNESA